MRFTTDQIATLTGGSVFGPVVEVDGATQDSRTVERGALFVPLIADRDGHDFIGAALAAGAAAYMTQCDPEGGSAVVVGDTALALEDLAKGARARLDGPVVGITGSVGKTSTKDLLLGVLGRSRVTHASVKSFNNEIGVPLTLLNAPDDVAATIVEMGSRGIGHIRNLCTIALPNVGIVTTVAGAHTGEFGSLENIAVAKGELVEQLPASGLAVLNADVALVSGMAPRTAASVLTFGRSPTADVRYSLVGLDTELRATMRVESDWGSFEARPATRGAHLLSNAAAAAAAALWLGCSLEQAAEGLASASLSPWRMEVGRTAGGATVINDTYNANPTSMRGALDSLAALPGRRKVAVLGYMAELGPSEGDEHREIAAYAAELGVTVVAVGTDLYGLAMADDPVAAIGHLRAGDAVLVKGSRAAGLEAVSAELCA